MLNIQHYTTLRRSFRLLIISLITCVLLSPAKAQFYNGSQVTFGKNRVQYTDFLWTYFRFNNLDVYYYLNGKEIAQHVADYAGRYMPVLEKKLGATLDQKTQFIVYNTFSDLKQSNLGLMNNLQYNTGGITHIIGTKVFLYFDGDQNHLEAQIRGGLARLMIESIIYGGSVGTQIKNNTLIDLPKWYIDGLVSYYSREWDTELDNKMKDGIISDKYRKFNHLLDEDAVIAGHSLWRFIAEKYGEDNVSNIINMTRVNRNVESGFLYTLGFSFKKIINEWHAWYKNYYTQIDFDFTPYNTLIAKKLKRDRVYDRIRLSPDGEKLLYTTNDKGLYKLYLYDLVSGKQKRIFRKGIRSDEKIDYSYPIAAWHPSGQIIAMILESKGQMFLYYYDMETKKWENQFLFNFQKILDFAYAPDGRNFVFSAVQKGQSDIFLYNIASNTAQPLTQDIYNDFNPRFLPGGNRIIFSSNRPDDSLRFVKNNLKPYDGMANHDLFIYDRNNSSPVLYRVARTPLANEINPVPYSPGVFSYLSDENGIYNRYAGRFDSAVAYIDTTVHYRYFTSTFPLTNYPRSILLQDVSLPGRKTAELINENNRYKIAIGEIALGKVQGISKLKKSSFVEESEIKYQKISEEENKKGNQKPVARRKRFVNVYQDEKNMPLPDSTLVDINNYQLSDALPVFTGNSKKASGVLNLHSDNALIKPPKPRNYNVEYSINQLVSQLDFSYLNMSYQPYLGYSGPIYQNPSTNALLTVGATDLMEDYRIIGGVRLNSDLTNNEYLLGFSQLKPRLDRELFFHRSGFDVSYSNAYIRHKVHELHLVLRYPFSEVLALKWTASLQHDNPIVLALDSITASFKVKPDIWGVGKTELIYDNTRQLGTNLMVGMRYKLFGEYYQLIRENAGNVNMAVVGFDFRHYTRIHRNFIWANRLAGSTSFGKNKLLYYMGGVDNWLLPKFSNEYQIDQTQSYAFQTLATNMRGFEQNVRSGNTFALLSSELRFPIFKYFFNKPLRYEILNNFQLVGFADLGSAWQGLNPLSDENTYYTKTIYQAPLFVTVKVQKDPLIAGYGFGARTTLFGYFVRADWAWGIEDKVINPRIFYLSLSLDF